MSIPKWCRHPLDSAKRWAGAVRRDALALWLGARDPRVPWYAKALALATAAYAFSPIDLIPDFIPVLGYLDDLLILPAAIVLTVRLIPADVMADLRSRASRRIEARPRSIAGAVVIGAAWIVAAALLAGWLWQRANGPGS